MNFFGLSPGELLLIMLLAMIVLGPEKLPEVAGSIGKWIREFRRATEELTQQFADENPFTEIQRALSLVDEPAAPAASAAAATPIVEAAVPAAMAAAAGAVVAVAMPANNTPTGPAVPPPIASDYFTRPAAYAAISDEWAHGSVPSEWPGPGAVRRFEAAAVVEDWAHGVPVPPDPLLDTILAASAELEANAALVQMDGDTVAEPADSISESADGIVESSDAVVESTGLEAVLEASPVEADAAATEQAEPDGRVELADEASEGAATEPTEQVNDDAATIEVNHLVIEPATNGHSAHLPPGNEPPAVGAGIHEGEASDNGGHR